MADIELVEDEKGDFYDITIYDKENLDSKGRPKLILFADLGITQAKLFISTEEAMSTPVLDNKTLALFSDSVVRWTIGSGEVPTANEYFAIVKMLDVSGSLVRFSNLLTVHVTPRIGTA